MEIKDYILFYVNGEARYFVFDDESLTNGFLDKYKKNYPNGQYAPLLTVENFQHVLKYGYKLVLRKLSDMTEEECDKYGIAYLNGEYTKDCFEADATYGTTFKVYGIKSLSERVIQMCKDGWDVFGLIPAGLAIDKTSLKN